MDIIIGVAIGYFQVAFMFAFFNIGIRVSSLQNGQKMSNKEGFLCLGFGALWPIILYLHFRNDRLKERK